MEGMEEVLTLIIKLIIIPAIPLLGLLLKTWVQKNIEKIQKEMDSRDLADFNEYLVALEDIVLGAVNSVQQTYVKQLEKDDVFTIERQKEAFEIARVKVMEQITERGKELLEKGLRDYEEFLEDKIESYVRMMNEGEK